MDNHQFKVLIPQVVHESGLNYLKENSCKLLFPKTGEKKELLKLSRDCHAILSRTVPIDKEIIENASKIKVIARHGIGVDHIDLSSATKKQVFICNTATASVNSVAEHVLGLMITTSHKIVNSDSKLRHGNFQYRNQVVGRDLSSRTLGLVGFGSIARSVAKKCFYGLNMKIYAFDPFIEKEVKEKFNYVTFVNSVEHLLCLDYVSLHVPYNSTTHHLIGEKEIGLMGKDTILINTSRGKVIDEEVLLKALIDTKIKGAGLDCFYTEPPIEGSKMWDLENIVVTPHMASHTEESLCAMSLEAAKEIMRVLNGELPKNLINKELIKQISKG